MISEEDYRGAWENQCRTGALVHPNLYPDRDPKNGLRVRPGARSHHREREEDWRKRMERELPQ